MSKKSSPYTEKIWNSLTILSAMATLATFFYPTISDAWNRYVSDTIIYEYTENIGEGYDYTREINEAISYNRDLFCQGTNNISRYTLRITDIETARETELSSEVAYPDAYYESMVNSSGNGMMGFIEIEKINVSLPIYHYTSEDILSKGVGHLYGSSLPVGGESSHAVLTGHSGLVSARLFTDLDKLQKGDIFILHVLGRDMRYCVENIETVLPRELSSLSIEEGKDLVTLVTCTPYGINTHRLLVHGRRIADMEKTEEEVNVDADKVNDLIKDPIFIFAIVIMVCLIFLIILIFIWR